MEEAIPVNAKIKKFGIFLLLLAPWLYLSQIHIYWIKWSCKLYLEGKVQLDLTQ
jgi:hypothetical protein